MAAALLCRNAVITAMLLPTAASRSPQVTWMLVVADGLRGGRSHAE
jgi:hypothetical protein